MRVVVLTLQKVELRDPSFKFQKISLSLKFGENTKKLPKPRFIRNKSANFYGEKISVSSTDASAKNILLSIYGINTVEEDLIGEVIVDVRKLEKKEDVNEFFQIQDGKFYMEFEAMYSSSMNLSPRNLNFTPKTPTASETQETIPTRLVKKESRDSVKDKQELDLMKQTSLNKLKALEKAESMNSPTQQLRRQQSLRKLNRSNSHLLNDDDKKSEISEKPSSKKKFERTLNSKAGLKDTDDTQKTKSQSAYRPKQTKNLNRERSVTPTKSVRSERSNISTTVKQQRAPAERKPKVEQTVKEEESAELGLKDYIKFIVISVVAMILGVAVKQW